MYVISAMVKYHFEDEAELRFAGCDDGGYGSGYPCWHRPNDRDVKYFNTIEKAEEWFSKCEDYLTTDGSRTVKELAITEITYNTAKPLSDESSVARTSVFVKPKESEKSNHLAGKSVDDVMICPKCGSDNCYEYSTDELEFSSDNTGHYFVDCRCRDCSHGFRLYTRFKYELTDIHT